MFSFIDISPLDHGLRNTGPLQYDQLAAAHENRRGC
jgi:hypothetical protein